MGQRRSIGIKDKILTLDSRLLLFLYQPDSTKRTLFQHAMFINCSSLRRPLAALRKNPFEGTGRLRESRGTALGLHIFIASLCAHCKQQWLIDSFHFTLLGPEEPKPSVSC